MAVGEIFDNLCWANYICIWKKRMMTPYFIPSTKNNSRCILDLSVKGRTMKLPYNTGESSHDVEVSKDFLDRTEKPLT